MTTEGVWSDPRTWISIISLAIGIVGLLFGMISSKWNRHESRLDALSKMLQPLVKVAQELMMANNARRQCEQLKFSFSNHQDFPDAVNKVNELIENYNEHTKTAQQEFRNAESEFASRSFRFPDKVSALVDTVQKSLAELGRLVTAGMFDKADLQLAQFRDDYAQVKIEGRGWRLVDPLEGFLKRIRRKKPETMPNEIYGITEKSMSDIMELVHKRTTTEANNTFVVHPPQKLLDKPDIASSESVIEELDASVFVIVFQDGTARMTTLAELMIFTYNLLVLAHHLSESSQIIKTISSLGSHEFNLKFEISPASIMRPAMVQVLLSKISFSTDASDNVTDLPL